MFASLSSAWMLRLKKYGYWIWLIAVLGIPLSYWWSLGSDYPNAWPWLVISVVFGLIPILDAIVGRDPANPEEASEVPEMEAQGYYRVLSLATVPLLLGMLVWSGWILAHETRWDWVGQLGWILSVGTVMGAIGITVSHELIHKDPQLEQNAGGLLLAAVCYAGFKVEHVRGHHVHVSTPEDASSSRYGQSLYSFLPHAYKHNFLNAWRLEAERLKRRPAGPALAQRADLVVRHQRPLPARLQPGLRLAGSDLLPRPVGDGLHPAGDRQLRRALRPASAAPGQRPLRTHHAGTLVEQQFPPDQPVPFPPAAPFRPPCLRQAPLPGAAPLRQQPAPPNGYAGMIVLALFPPLWRAVMDPKVRAYYAGEEYQLTDTQRI